jgi:hypothetical protein
LAAGFHDDGENLQAMEAESDIVNLIRNMQPRLDEQPFVFCQLVEKTWRNLAITPICLFKENEGWTAILEETEAIRAGISYEGTWAHIVLEVYSDLNAVGFLAQITSVLAENGIPVNPVSAFHHDHLFVPWELRDTALMVLRRISGQ